MKKHKRVSTVAVAGFLFVISFLLYGGALQGGFVLDAHTVVENNPVIKQPQLYPRIFTQELFGGRSHRNQSALNSSRDRDSFEFNYYRPVVLMTFALDYRLWKLNPFGFKLTNLLLHGLNSFLVFLLISGLTPRPRAAILAAVFFCILPVQEWVVNYVVGRADLLQTAFELLSLLCFLKFGEVRRPRWYAASLITFGLALLAREVAIAHPLILTLVWFRWDKNKRNWSQVIPFFAVSALYLVFRSILFPIQAQTVSANMIPYGQWLGEWLRIFAAYVLRFLFPWTVQAAFPVVMKAGFWKLVITSALIVWSIAASVKMFLLKKEKDFIFGWAWIFINFLPFFLLIPQVKFLGPILSEHYLYLASAGFVFLLARFLSQESYIHQAVTMVLVVYCSMVTAANHAFWTTEENLLRRVQSLEGEGYVATDQLLLRYASNPNEILPRIDQARTDRERGQWYNRLGTLQTGQKQFAQAEHSFLEALQYEPDQVDSLLGLAFLAEETGRGRETADFLLRALRKNPESDKANYFLGILLYRMEKFLEAQPFFERAYFYNPDAEDHLLYLALNAYFNRQKEIAGPLIRRAVFKSRDGFAGRFLAAEIYNHGYVKEAVTVLRQGLKKFPRDAAALILLGKIYANLGQLEKAQDSWRSVLEFDPNNQEALSLCRRML